MRAKAAIDQALLMDLDLRVHALAKRPAGRLGVAMQGDSLYEKRLAPAVSRVYLAPTLYDCPGSPLLVD